MTDSIVNDQYWITIPERGLCLIKLDHFYKWTLLSIMKIPGVSFSWKRALGITQAKQQISRKTGIPLTKSGLERKVGRSIIDALFGKNK